MIRIALTDFFDGIQVIQHQPDDFWVKKLTAVLQNIIRRGETGVMAGVERNELTQTPLQDTWMERKKLSQELIDIQTKLFNPVKKERHKATQK